MEKGITFEGYAVDKLWLNSENNLNIEKPGEQSTLRGVVKSYTCKGYYGTHAAMRAVMCLTGWLGMQNNYASGAARSFCDYIGTSHCLGLFDDTWLVEVYDDGWHLYMLRLSPEGLWDVRWLKELESSCKPLESNLPTITRENFKSFHITPLGIDDDEWRDVASDLVAACMAAFGVQYLSRCDAATMHFWQRYGMDATVRLDSVVRDDVFLNITLQPYGALIRGTNITRYEVFREAGSWYVGREGAQKAEEERRGQAIMAMLD